jgi:LmbE family N-acetylglucosaminyl deacetylase
MHHLLDAETQAVECYYRATMANDSRIDHQSMARATSKAMQWIKHALVRYRVYAHDPIDLLRDVARTESDAGTVKLLVDTISQLEASHATNEACDSSTA